MYLRVAEQLSSVPPFVPLQAQVWSLLPEVTSLGALRLHKCRVVRLWSF